MTAGLVQSLATMMIDIFSLVHSRDGKMIIITGILIHLLTGSVAGFVQVIMVAIFGAVGGISCVLVMAGIQESIIV